MKTNLNSGNIQLQIFTPRFIALGALALLLLWGLTGCSSSHPDGGAGSANLIPGNIAGEYTLVSVNGKPVPCGVRHEDADIQVKSGVFTINADGTCRSESKFNVPPHADVNRVVDATYTVSGNKLTMHWHRAGTTTGTVDGGTFTMNNEGMIFLYRK